MKRATISRPRHYTPTGHKLRADAGALARFVSYKAEPSLTPTLRASHPAISEGRTIFPGRVTAVADMPRLLVSGVNNSKIGGRVRKGDWAGMPIFTLTLEERATCPRSCGQWAGCYGSSMHWPRRIDVADPAFFEALAREVVAAALANPAGLVIRLHILGDFFSVRYVRLWAALLGALPQLRVFGYTARRTDRDDAESRKIALCLAELTRAWSRFAVRTSHGETGPRRAIVVDEPPDDEVTVMCPAQTEATQACATCAFCWTDQNKAVGFLRHGMKRRGRKHA